MRIRELINFVKLFVTTVCAFGLSFHATNALSGIVAFGDSLTDNGNTSQRFEKYIIPKFIWTVPNKKAYYEGRFSNGLVWVETVASDLALPLEDKAQGAANSYNDAVRIPLLYPSGLILSLIHQVDAYLNESNGFIDPQKLYVLWIGGNDYVLSNEHDPNKVIAATMESLTKLYHAGAQNFLVMNLPDLTIAPLVQEQGTKWKPQELKNILDQHNSELARQVENFQRSTDAIHIELYDVNTAFQKMSANPGDYGFTNIKNRCYEGGFIFKFGDPIQLGPAELSILKALEEKLTQGSKIKYSNFICPDADTYLFWDTMHPTAHTHKIFGQMVSQFIRERYPDDFDHVF